MKPHRTDNQFVSFLYEILRDHLPAGTVEKIVSNAEKDVERLGEGAKDFILSNGHLGQYAEEIYDRLCRISKESDLVIRIEEDGTAVRNGGSSSYSIRGGPNREIEVRGFTSVSIIDSRRSNQASNQATVAQIGEKVQKMGFSKTVLGGVNPKEPTPRPDIRPQAQRPGAE